MPVYEGMRVTLDEMAFDEAKGQFVPTDAVYGKVSGAGYDLWLKAARPEGGPQLRITLQYGDAPAQYFVTYHGRDGTLAEEYINKQ